IAYIHGGPSNFGFVGIDHVNSNGNGATIDSMVYGRDGTGGGVGSDGYINLGNGDVYGDARPGTGQKLIQKNNSDVTGWTAPLDYTLAGRPEYQPVTVPTNAIAVDYPGRNTDWLLPPATVPPSTSAANPRVLVCNTTVDQPKSIQVTGYVKLYVVGSFKVDGSRIINDANPPPI